MTNAPQLVSITGVTQTHTVVVTYAGFAIDHHGTGDSYTVHNSRAFTVESDHLFDDKRAEQVLNRLYSETNRYEGKLYETLGADFESRGIRARTTLSIGDMVTIDARTYICAPTGWVKLDRF